jgi:amidase
MYFGYTGVWNVLDYSAAVVKVGQVNKEVDKVDATYKPQGQFDEGVWAQCKRHPYLSSTQQRA